MTAPARPRRRDRAVASPRAAEGEARQEGRALDQLRRKYAQLCAKYEAAVARASERAVDEIGTVALALSAMRASPSALALADRERLLFANARWSELTREGGRFVRLRGAEPLPAHGTLREVADAGTAAVLATKAGDTLVARYEAERGGAGWDFRFDRTRYGRRAVAMIVATEATQAIRDERELDAARRRMAEQQRLRTIGLLTAGVSHDFANALNAAGMHLGLIVADAALTEPIGRHAKAVQRILAGMADRTKRLRELARERQELAIQRLELGGVVAAAVELARAEFRSRAWAPVEIAVDPAVDALPAIRGAGSELVHVVLNLLLNARDAMREGGTVHVGGRADDDAVTLVVEDEGPGIPPQDLPRMFEPFFTTKGEGGNGLGLATAYGLLRELQGDITVANRPSGGAAFSLRFRRWK